MVCISEALLFEWARWAVCFIRLKLHEAAMADVGILALEPQRLVRGATAGLLVEVNLEVFDAEFFFGLEACFGFVSFEGLETWVA